MDRGKSMRIRTASIYWIPNYGYIIFGMSKTTVGADVASDPFFNVPEIESDADKIADIIKASLCNDDSKRVPHPVDWKEFDKIFLKKTGVKSMRDFNKPTTKLVTVTSKEDKILFSPMRPEKKPDKGFIPLIENEDVEVSDSASNKDIVDAFKFALEKCL